MSRRAPFASLLSVPALTILLCACAGPAPTASDRQLTDDHASATSYSATIQSDLARLRAWDAAGPVSVGTTWGRDATVNDVIGRLEGLLARRAAPRAFYEMFQTSGASAVTVDGGPPSSRTVQFSAWTHCTGCSSGSTETGGEMTMTLVQGGSYTYGSSRFGNLSPYSSGWYNMSISGDRADASITTRHYIKYTANTYTKYSSAGATV